MLLFCRLTSNFAPIKIRNVRLLSALSGCTWNHSWAFSAPWMDAEKAGQKVSPSVFINSGCLKGVRRWAEFSCFHAPGDKFEIFQLMKPNKGWAFCFSWALIRINWLHPVWAADIWICDRTTALAAFSLSLTSRAWSLRPLLWKQERMLSWMWSGRKTHVIPISHASFWVGVDMMPEG